MSNGVLILRRPKRCVMDIIPAGLMQTGVPTHATVVCCHGISWPEGSYEPDYCVVCASGVCDGEKV